MAAFAGLPIDANLGELEYSSEVSDPRALPAPLPRPSAVVVVDRGRGAKENSGVLLLLNPRRVVVRGTLPMTLLIESLLKRDMTPSRLYRQKWHTPRQAYIMKIKSLPVLFF